MDKTLFAQRRERFFQEMQDGIAIFRSAPTAVRSLDIDHPYRQDSDFLFLTGLQESDSAAILIKNGAQRRYLLFVEPLDPEVAVWDGANTGLEGACKEYGADEAYPIESLFEQLSELLNNQPRLYVMLGREAEFERRLLALMERMRGEARKGISAPWEILDPRIMLWYHRLIKTHQDIQAIEAACRVTEAGVLAAMKAVMPGMMEFELQAVVEFEYRRRGSKRFAFETICAAGNNAATLHYIDNNTRIADGQMVLLDTGAEFGDVSADITRTFPANGRYSPGQRTVYEWVLRAQKAARAAARPGGTYAQIHEAALHVLCEGLIDMGVLKGCVAQVIEEETYRPYFMHRIGHWLGSDVHDVGPYFEQGESIVMREGMVMTIEPGLYLSLDSEAPQALRGIGVRIEDDILLTSDGNRVLTPNVPREVEDIERFMALPQTWWDTLKPLL